MRNAERGQALRTGGAATRTDLVSPIRQPRRRFVAPYGAHYRLRKQTVEPVFGIVKQAMGFRQFLLRGLEKVAGEWALVTLAYNSRRLHNLRLA